MALATASLVALVVGMIVAGLFLGVMNTVLTESVMLATELPRQVASSTYSGIRFFGGAFGPGRCRLIAAHLGAGGPYWFGGAAMIIAIVVLVVGRRRSPTSTGHESESQLEEATVLTAADA